MPDYRRAWVPGGTFFFTLVTDRRRPLFRSLRARTLLGNVFRRCQGKWPFTINALVLLPDHLHAIWSLPPGDAAYPTPWA
jgi:putative transposase